MKNLVLHCDYILPTRRRSRGQSLPTHMFNIVCDEVAYLPVRIAIMMQKLHFITGKTLKDVRNDVITHSRSRSWMRAVLLLLLFGVIGAVIACKYVFEDQLRSLEYTKRVTGYKACAAISGARKPTCFCTNATSNYTRCFTSLLIEGAIDLGLATTLRPCGTLR